MHIPFRVIKGPIYLAGAVRQTGDIVLLDREVTTWVPGVYHPMGLDEFVTGKPTDRATKIVSMSCSAAVASSRVPQSNVPGGLMFAKRSA
jgi:hypothetical protein